MRKLTGLLMIVLMLFTTAIFGCADAPQDEKCSVIVSAEYGTVTWNDGFNGEVKKLSNVSFTFDADEGYKLTSVKINGQEHIGNVSGNVYDVATLSQYVYDDITIEAQFTALATYTAEVIVEGDNGKAFFTGYGENEYTSILIKETESAQIKIVPNAGYKPVAKIGTQVVNLTNEGSYYTYVASSVMSSFSLNVSFEPLSAIHTVTVNATSNGSVTADKNEVADGGNVTFSFAPANGYKVESVTVNGEDKTSSLVGNTLILENVSENLIVSATFAPITYAVTVITPVNGTVTADATTVTAGGVVAFTITPASGYELDSVTVNGIDKTADVISGILTVSAVDADLQVVANFKLSASAYTVTVNEIQNGSVIADKNAVEAGDSVVFTITPASGYVLDTVTVNGQDKTAEVVGNTLTVSNVSANLVVVATFKPGVASYTVTVESSVGGSVIADKTSVTAGDSVVFTITPANGYAVDTVTVNGEDKTAQIVGSVLTVSNVSANLAVVATFKTSVISYPVTIAGSINGSVTADKESVVKGGSVVFTIAPEVGYVLSSITVNEIDRTADVVNGTLTITNVTSALAVSAGFAEQTYNLTLPATVENGSLSASKTVYGAGEEVIITVSADAHYELVSFTVNGKDMLDSVVGGEFVFDINEDTVIEASFAQIMRTVSLTYNRDGGSLTCSPSATVVDGRSVQITVTPASGYALESLTDNGEDVTASVTAANKYVIANISDDHEIVAVFAKTYRISHFISEDSQGSGTVSLSKSSAVAGAEVEVTVLPDEGFVLSKFEVNGVDALADLTDGKYLLVVEGRTQIEVAFASAYTVTINATNGVVVADKTTALSGTEITVTLIPADGLMLKSFTVNGENKMTEIVDGKYVFTIEADTEINAIFGLDGFIVVARPCEGGLVEIDLPIAQEGDEVTVAFTPDQYFVLEALEVNGTAVSLDDVIDGIYKLIIAEDTTINATFARVTYDMTLTAQAGGEIIGEATAQAGLEYSVTITPDERYQILTVTDNDVDVTDLVENGVYTIACVTEAHEIEVAFIKICSVSYSIVGEQYGSITVDKESVLQGEKIIITATAIEGYELSTLTVNGVSVGIRLDNIYTVTVNEDVAIVATFGVEQQRYSVTITQADYGHIEADVTYGLEGTQVTLTIYENHSTLQRLVVSCVSNNTQHTKVTIGEVGGVAVKLYTFTLTQDTTVTARFTATNYDVTINAMSNGGVTTSATRGKYGDNVTLTASPAAGCRLVALYVNGDDVTAQMDGNTYVHTIDGPVSVSATFEEIRYTVAMGAMNNGAIDFSETEVKVGTTVTATVIPSTGYAIDTVTVNGVDMTASLVGDKLEIVVNENTEVVATFVLVEYAITVTQGSNGTILVDKTRGYYGDKVVITVTPAKHSELTLLRVGGVDRTQFVYFENGVGQYEFEIQKDTAITATFSKIKYAITTEKDGVGTLASAKATAAFGDTSSITVAPSDGYEIIEFTVGGVDKKGQIANNTYTLTVNDEALAGGSVVEIYAKFELVGACYITVDNSGEYGSISSASTVCVAGKTISVTVSPDDYCELKTLTVTGKSGTTTYTAADVNRNVCTVMITEDATIKATFAPTTYNVTLTNKTPTGGTANINKNSASYFDDIVVTATPNSGWHLIGVVVNGVEYKVANDKATVSKILQDCAIEVTFEQDTSTPTYKGRVVDEGGAPVYGVTVSASGASSATTTTDKNGYYSFKLASGSYTFTATANGFYTNTATAPATKYQTYNVENDIVLAHKRVGVTLGSHASDVSKVSLSYDANTKSETWTTVGNYNAGRLYLDGMDTVDGVVYFSAINTTTLSGSYENDPGIGFSLTNGSYTVAPQIAGNRTRYVVNDWNHATYTSNGSGISYNVQSNGDRKLHYFAFAKKGDCLYFLISENGVDGYKVISSYSDVSLGGKFAFAFATSTNSTTCTVTFNHIRFYNSTESIDYALAPTYNVISAHGTVNVGGPKGSVNTISITPDAGYYLSTLKVSGTNVSFTQNAAGQYEATATVFASNPTVEAIYNTTGDSIIEYSTGIEGSMNFDSSLFYRNDQFLYGADPGVIYVDPEDDPINGGWFYMAITGGETNDGSRDTGAFPIFRSRDLNSWEECGGYNGYYGLAVPADSWMMGTCWAPELYQETYELANGTKKNRYYIYFSAKSKQGNSSTSYTDAYDPDEGDSYWTRLYLGIGVSNSPQGPYTLVDTSTYYNFYNGLDTSLAANSQYKTFGYSSSTYSRKNNLNNETLDNQDPPLNFWKNNALSIQSDATYKKIKNMPAIDISPFKDPSTGKMYLYFSQHTVNTTISVDGNTIWVMEMKDYITPNYSTMHIVSVPGYSVKTTNFKQLIRSGNLASNYGSHVERFYYDGNANGGGINEGAHTIAHYDTATKQWLYYLTYSPFGYGSRAYSICQAVATSPMGPFKKLPPNSGYTAVGITNWSNSSTGAGTSGIDYNQTNDFSASIDYMAGTGHHSFVTVGDQIYAVYHAFPNPVNNNQHSVGTTNYSMLGRCIAIDEVTFVKSPTLKYNTLFNNSSGTVLPVLYGNGPTYSLQPLPSKVSGYDNVANKATVTTSTGGNKQYLTDGLFVTHSVYKDWEYYASGNSTITLDYTSNPQRVRAIMVYNSAQYKYALKKISNITIHLAERPAGYTSDTITFNNVTNNEDNAYDAKKVMRFGGSALVSFEEVRVKKIVFTINPTADTYTGSNDYRIGDIQVLGRVAGAAQSSITYGNALGVDTDGLAILDGVADEAIYANVTPYTEDFGDFHISTKAVRGKKGFYVAVTVNDKHIYSAGIAGETDNKFQALNRWYKNSYVRVAGYAGNQSTCDRAKVKYADFSPYTMRASIGKSYVVGGVNIQGAINGGATQAFNIEAYFPYEQFGSAAAPDNLFVHVEYQRAVNKSDYSYDTAQGKITRIPDYYKTNNGSHGMLLNFIKFDDHGPVGSFSTLVGRSVYSDSEYGQWTASESYDGSYTTKSTSEMESATYVKDAVGNSFVYTANVQAYEKRSSGYGGIILRSSTHHKVYSLGLNSGDGTKINKITVYSSTLGGAKTQIYTDNGAIASKSSLNVSLKVIKAGSLIYLYVNDKCVYVETDTRFAGGVHAGLYSDEASVAISGVRFTDYTDDESGLFDSVDNKLNAAIINTDGYAHANATSDGSTINLSVFSTTSGKQINAVTVNGASKTLTAGGKLSITSVTKDQLISITTKAATTYAVSGEIIDPLAANTAQGIKGSILFQHKTAAYAFECTNVMTYTAYLISGDYNVYVYKDCRPVAQYSLSVSGAKTQNYNIGGSTIFNPNLEVTIDGNINKSSGTITKLHSGDGLVTEDSRGLGSYWINTGATNYFAFETTIECFADSTVSSYEKEATIVIMFTNGSKLSYIGFAGKHIRYSKDNLAGWDPVNIRDVLSTSLCDRMAINRVRFINRNGAWSLHVYNTTLGKWENKFSLTTDSTWATGNCNYAIYTGTSFAITRIRYVNCSVYTGATAVNNLYNSSNG